MWHCSTVSAEAGSKPKCNGPLEDKPSIPAQVLNLTAAISLTEQNTGAEWVLNPDPIGSQSGQQALQPSDIPTEPARQAVVGCF